MLEAAIADTAAVLVDKFAHLCSLAGYVRSGRMRVTSSRRAHRPVRSPAVMRSYMFLSSHVLPPSSDVSNLRFQLRRKIFASSENSELTDSFADVLRVAA
jgi:hypothetical protein